MATYSTNEWKGGLKVIYEGDPCVIIENEYVKPGKGQAFNRVRMKNLKTGRQWKRPSSPANRWKAPTSSIARCSTSTTTASSGTS